MKGDPNTVNYSLFPREDHTQETMQAPSSAILPFPPEQVQQAIEDGRDNNTDMLLTALMDVQAYMKVSKFDQKLKIGNFIIKISGKMLFVISKCQIRNSHFCKLQSQFFMFRRVTYIVLNT